ncbi:MAG: precorrin-2 C(20)-methyltransferase [Firmicutes bacterium]|nr:precorrin-2 C(20)-methyltransferase [Bacillota bacterium]
MRGRLYGIGVGPGDPELLTLKAVRTIENCTVIAVPGKKPAETYAFDIARQAVPGVVDKQILAIDWPMTKDPDELRQIYRSAADTIEEQLEKGSEVAFLTIGDVSIYSTFIYVMKQVRADGYETEMVPGITSFSAIASVLGESLTEHEEMLHVVPAGYVEAADLPGTVVLMKPGKDLREIKRFVKDSGRKAMMVEKCGLPEERVYRSLDEMPDEAGYLTTVIVFDRKE